MNENQILNKNKLFNPDGESFGNQLIGGNTTGLLVMNEGRYKKRVHELYQYGVSVFWIPEKIDMTNDKKQYPVLLPEDKRAYDHILSFLIFLDSVQTNNPMNFTKVISASEFSLLIAIQIFQEAIHSQSYSYITETVMDSNTRKRTYDLWRQHPYLLKRNKYIAEIYEEFEANPTIRNFCKALLANFILEGIYFYNGFKFFYNLAERGFMSGSANMIKLINRDEIFHLNMYEFIINTLKEEGHWVLSDDEVYNLMEEAVSQEIEFSIDILDNCLGFNEKIINEYTKFLANKRLKAIGYPNNPWKDYISNPRKKYDSIIEADGEIDSEENIFTGSSSSYIKADSIDGWSELI